MSLGLVEAGGSCRDEELTVKVKAAGHRAWAGQSISLWSLTQFTFRNSPGRACSPPPPPGMAGAVTAAGSPVVGAMTPVPSGLEHLLPA